MHKLTDINESNGLANCSICGMVSISIRDKTKKKLNSKYRCRNVHRASNNRHSYPYRKHKKDHCELCNFIPKHPCQLDVDHIDGNNKNNDVSNLQTLCANCHRYKTFLNKDGSYKN